MRERPGLAATDLVAADGPAFQAGLAEGEKLLPLYLVLAGLTAGLAMIVWSMRRGAPAPLRDGATRTRISDLEPGRFQITGRVVPIRTTASEVDGAPCVYLERARYEQVGGGLLPLLREVAHGYAAHSFYLDDGSGRILVDPAATLIECATAITDGGLVAERRLRAGEEIELVARFRPADGTSGAGLDAGPYRAPASAYEPAADAVGPPRITYRTEPGMERAGLDEMTTFLRGAGALMVAISTLFGGLIVWLQWFLSQGR